MLVFFAHALCELRLRRTIWLLATTPQQPQDQHVNTLQNDPRTTIQHKFRTAATSAVQLLRVCSSDDPVVDPCVNVNVVSISITWSVHVHQSIAVLRPNAES